MAIKQETKIDAGYVNRKMESMMSAIFDTIGENEERIRNLEKQIYEIKNGKSNTSSQEGSYKV